MVQRQSPDKNALWVERRPINDLKPDQEMTNHIRPYKKWYVSGFVLCFLQILWIGGFRPICAVPSHFKWRRLNKRQIPERNLTID
jgi:hypothetical protein